MERQKKLIPISQLAFKGNEEKHGLEKTSDFSGLCKALGIQLREFCVGSEFGIKD